jgi:DNA-binding beta-propeller fold protein YncE
LYVLDFSGLLITVDATEGHISDVLALPGQPHRILVSPDGSKAYIANNALDQLYIVNLHSRRVISTIDLGGSQWAMDISLDGQYLFVPLFNGKEVVVINTSTNEIVRSFGTTGNPTAVLLDQPVFKVFLSPIKSDSANLTYSSPFTPDLFAGLTIPTYSYESGNNP